ncbi:MAG: iron ABC transporter permease, partial [Casimicrobiaceae bacterium]
MALPTDLSPRRRDVAAWILVAWASLLLLPWYQVEGGLFSFDWLAHPANARSAALLAFDARPWLFPLALAPLIATWLYAQRRMRGIGVAAALGIAWLLAEGFSITNAGWGYAWLAALFATPGPKQSGVGWGAVFYAVAMLMLLAMALAHRGWCKGDRFIVAALLLVIASMLLFVAYPLLSILLSALKDNSGNIAPSQFAGKLFSASIWSLRCLSSDSNCGSAWNTVALAVLVGVLCTALGLPLALIALRTRLRAKWL